MANRTTEYNREYMREYRNKPENKERITKRRHRKEATNKMAIAMLTGKLDVETKAKVYSSIYESCKRHNLTEEQCSDVLWCIEELLEEGLLMDIVKEVVIENER